MAQIIHNISTPNDHLGDELRTAMGNQNSMNTELYTNKVDKVTGKDLSSNDFTNTYVTKLDGIESGAEVNVQADLMQNDNTQDDFVKNKDAFLASLNLQIVTYDVFVFVKKGFGNAGLIAGALGDVYQGWFSAGIYSIHAVYDGVGDLNNPASFDHKQFIEY